MSYAKFLDEAGEYAVWREDNNMPKLHHEKTFEIIRDLWIDDKRYNELISFILENWDSGNCDDFISPLVSALIEQKEINQLKKLWMGIISNRTEKLWIYTKKQYDWEKLDKIDVSKFDMCKTSCYRNAKKVAAFYRKFTLEAIDNYIQALEQLNEQKEIENLQPMRENIYYFRKPKQQ